MTSQARLDSARERKDVEMKRIKRSAEARITARFKSRQQMEAIAEALRPEILYPAGDKANARITKRGRTLKLQFEARDSVALRAIMTSYLRLLGTAVNVSRSVLELEINHKTKRAHAMSSRN